VNDVDVHIWLLAHRLYCQLISFWCVSVFDWRKILAACSMLVRSGGAGMGNAESAAGDFLAVEMCILPWQDGALVAGMV